MKNYSKFKSVLLNFFYSLLSQDSRENKKKFLDSSQGRTMVETGSFFSFYFDLEASFRRIYNGTNLQIFTNSKKFYSTQTSTRIIISLTSQSFIHRHNITTHEKIKFIHDSSFAKKKVEMPFF